MLSRIESTDLRHSVAFGTVERMTQSTDGHSVANWVQVRASASGPAYGAPAEVRTLSTVLCDSALNSEDWIQRDEPQRTQEDAKKTTDDLFFLAFFEPLAAKLACSVRLLVSPKLLPQINALQSGLIPHIQQPVRKGWQCPDRAGQDLLSP